MQKLVKCGQALHERQAVSTSRKGGDANGYIFRAVSALFGTDWFCWSDYSDLQEKMTAPCPSGHFARNRT